MGEDLSYFVTDDRHAVPTLIFLPDETESGAWAKAHADLAANPHHLAVEVRAGERLLFTLERPDRSQAPQ